MATGTTKKATTTELTVTPTGNFNSVGIHAFKGTEFVTIGGYFANTTAKAGNVATISNLRVKSAGDMSTPCQCDDNSVQWVSFEVSGDDLIVKIGSTLTANKYVRFLCTLAVY